jgi:hypothetical protein
MQMHSPAFFASAVSYNHKMFMKLKTGVGIIKLSFFAVVDLPK